VILTFKYLLIIQAIFVYILFSSQSLTSVELKSFFHIFAHKQFD